MCAAGVQHEPTGFALKATNSRSESPKSPVEQVREVDSGFVVAGQDGISGKGRFAEPPRRNHICWLELGLTDTAPGCELSDTNSHLPGADGPEIDTVVENVAMELPYGFDPVWRTWTTRST